MRKIMFSTKFCLEQAVLDGKKTQTRREVKFKNDLVLEESIVPALERCWKQEMIEKYARFKVGEVVAIAQAYKNINRHLTAMARCMINPWGSPKENPGWNNKMFVSAGLMPYGIEITEVRMERLQEISDEDILQEGISPLCPFSAYNPETGAEGSYSFKEMHQRADQVNISEYVFTSPREAYAALIDAINGNGTWERNPWMMAYTFKLVEL